MTGTTTSVSSVEVMTPPMIARPIGACVSPLSPKPSASGNMPKIIAAVVIRMGRRRTCPAVSSASCSDAPLRRERLAKSTSRIAFLVTKPISITKPIIDRMLSVVLVNSSASSTPISVNGSEAMIATGWVKLANCEARTR